MITPIIVVVLHVNEETIMRPKSGAFSRYRPRVLTLIVLIVVAAPTVLANFSPSNVASTGYSIKDAEYGWPLTWYWRNYALRAGDTRAKWSVVRYNWSRLAGNLAIWSVMLAAVGASCEWLLRRYRPTLNWSLKTMLAAVGLVGVFCMWCVGLREPANDQDSLIATIEVGGQWHSDGTVYGSVSLERWGPKWLDLVGVDRFRRRIVGVTLRHDDDIEELLKRIGRIPNLRYLDLQLHKWTPSMTATLGEMRQLRSLRIEKRQLRTSWTRKLGSFDAFDERLSDEILAAIGKLNQLKVLSLNDMLITNKSLQHLATLTSLKSLRLEDPSWDGEDGTELEYLASIGRPPTLTHLPLLPRLEAVGFHGGRVRAPDLRQLATFPRLKAIDLTESYIIDAALAELASLESLEELAIGNGKVSAASLESLAAIKGLKALHIDDIGMVDGADDSDSDTDDSEPAMDVSDFDADDSDSDTDDSTGLLPLDSGELFVKESEVERYCQALEALRQSNPGIVIDDVTDSFDERRIWHGELPQWLPEQFRWPDGSGIY